MNGVSRERENICMLVEIEALWLYAIMRKLNICMNCEPGAHTPREYMFEVD